MTVTKTARQKPKRNSRHMETTLALYRKAEAFLNRIAFAEWPNMGGFTSFLYPHLRDLL